MITLDTPCSMPYLPHTPTPPPKNKPTLVIHIGLLKTATTTLQQKLFPYLENINYLGIGPEDKDPRVFPTHKYFLFKWFTFPRPTASIPPIIHPTKVNLYSQENIYWNIYHKKFKVLHHFEKLNELYNLRVIVTIRKQANLIFSLYMYLIKLLGRANFPFDRGLVLSDEYSKEKDQKNRVKELVEKKAYPLVTDKAFDYSQIFKDLNQYLPKKNILFVPMESLVSSDEKTLNQLIHFITQRPPTAEEKKLAGKLQDYKVNESPHPDYEREKQRFIQSGFYQRIFNIYKKSNQWLASITQMDLKGLGYY